MGTVECYVATHKARKNFMGEMEQDDSGVEGQTLLSDVGDQEVRLGENIVSESLLHHQIVFS